MAWAWRMACKLKSEGLRVRHALSSSRKRLKPWRRSVSSGHVAPSRSGLDVRDFKQEKPSQRTRRSFPEPKSAQRCSDRAFGQAFNYSSLDAMCAR